MPKTISLTTALLFFIWILPLGVFIKPAQEKFACNGQRAICLCSHLMAKKSSSQPAKIINPSGGTQKDAGGPGGANHDFWLTEANLMIPQKISKYLHQPTCLYSFLDDKSIEHVPKV